MLGKERCVDHQCTILPPSDGMALVRARALPRMAAAVHVHGSVNVEELASNHDRIAPYLDLIQVRHALQERRGERHAVRRRIHLVGIGLHRGHAAAPAERLRSAAG
jgi:hypothetical protein